MVCIFHMIPPGIDLTKTNNFVFSTTDSTWKEHSLTVRYTAGHVNAQVLSSGMQFCPEFVTAASTFPVFVDAYQQYLNRAAKENKKNLVPLIVRHLLQSQLMMMLRRATAILFTSFPSKMAAIPYKAKCSSVSRKWTLCTCFCSWKMMQKTQSQEVE